ncbi:hypothetical protein [Chryseobacterium indologenes]|uniref:hypothetical protein n=1 Tax=Chryseobacterium indologenes TaxID=253 RepID=UPI0016232F71|nr:hypothetical protein [Chryseobacterium indologenes]
MQDTIGKYEEHFDKQVFRVTYKLKDYQVILLKKDLKKDLKEISILLDGVVQKMIKEEGKWHFEHGNDRELANDIWRAISLRYRIFA